MSNAPSAKNIALWIVGVIFFMVLAKCSCHALTPSEREIVTQAQGKIVELRGQLEAQQVANNAALASLTLSAVQVTDLLAAAKVAQDQAAALTAERDGLKDEGIVKDAKIARLNSQYQFAQFIIAGVSAFAVALLVFQFTKSLPLPYNVVAPLGAAGVAYGVICILI
jgi:hypothetical protein